eukprot:ANDGO_07190.mRNA.1 Serine/threonine-protein kinase cst-1
MLPVLFDLENTLIVPTKNERWLSLSSCWMTSPVLDAKQLLNLIHKHLDSDESVVFLGLWSTARQESLFTADDFERRKCPEIQEHLSQFDELLVLIVPDYVRPFVDNVILHRNIVELGLRGVNPVNPDSRTRYHDKYSMLSKENTQSLGWASKSLLHECQASVSEIACDWMFQFEQINLWRFDRCLSLLGDDDSSNAISKVLKEDLNVHIQISPSYTTLNRPSLFGFLFSPLSAFGPDSAQEPVFGATFDNEGKKFVVGCFLHHEGCEDSEIGTFGNLHPFENSSLEFHFTNGALRVRGLTIAEIIVDENTNHVAPTNQRTFCLHHVQIEVDGTMVLWFRWGSRILLCLSLRHIEGELKEVRYSLWTLDSDTGQRNVSLGCASVTWSSQKGFAILPSDYFSLRNGVSVSLTDVRRFPDFQVVSAGIRMCLGSHSSYECMHGSQSFTSLANCDCGEILLFERSSHACIANFIGRIRSGRLVSDEDCRELWMEHNATMEGRFVDELPSGIMKLTICGNVEYATYRNGRIVEEIISLSERYAAFIQQLRDLFSTDEIFLDENESSLLMVLHGGLPVCLFCVRCVIGSGAEAVVYRGLTLHHGPVAVKIFRRSIGDGTEEAKTQQFFSDQMDHLGEEELFGRIPRQSTGQFPSLVRVLYIGAVDSGRSVGSVLQQESALVMSYYPEGDVFGKNRRIQENLSPRLLFHQLNLLASTVAALHEAQLIHRDIKPSNILLNNNGSSGSYSFCLTDFGISSVRLEAQTYVDSSANPNYPLGSPWWRPPEFVHQPALRTPRSDVFSLGWTMLYLAQVQRMGMTSEYLQHACQVSSALNSDLFSSGDENEYFTYSEMVNRDLQSLRDGHIQTHLRTDVHSTTTSRILFSHLLSRMQICFEKFKALKAYITRISNMRTVPLR